MTASNPVTPEDYARARERELLGNSSSLSWIIASICASSRRISNMLQRAGIDDILGSAGNENVQGEDQQKLDVIANDVLIEGLRGQDGVATIGSEEDDELILTGSADANGNRFAVLFDPLDGSSNLDVGGAVGTIFSIFRIEGDDPAQLLSGRHQIAAGYVLYGPTTILIMTLGDGTHQFVLDRGPGVFVLVKENLRVPSKGKIYSVNEANLASFPAGYQAYIKDCHEAGHSARYAGAMVADVHRILLKGGVFMYPPTEKAPNGKLRLMYECNPMAMLIEQAGGAATVGSVPGDVLTVEPEELHQRVPIALGSTDNVDAVLARLKS